MSHQSQPPEVQQLFAGSMEAQPVEVIAESNPVAALEETLWDYEEVRDYDLGEGD